jgi:hypothetical protein
LIGYQEAHLAPKIEAPIDPVRVKRKETNTGLATDGVAHYDNCKTRRKANIALPPPPSTAPVPRPTCANPETWLAQEIDRLLKVSEKFRCHLSSSKQMKK